MPKQDGNKNRLPEIAERLSDFNHQGFLPERLTEASPDSVLAQLFRTIARDNGLNIPILKTLLTRYLDKFRIPSVDVVSSDNKSNFMKEIASETMSWRVFLRNLTIIDIVKIDLKVTAYYRSKKVTDHLSTVYLDPSLIDQVKKEENGN